MQLPGLHHSGQEDSLDRPVGGGLQAPGARADGAKLGRVDGLPAAQAGAIPAGLDGVLGISQYYRSVPELDDWIRRRIRMCYWKQWRWVRTKIKHLLALGVSLKTAIQHGVSSKSYWHMARTPALQQACPTRG